VSRKYYKFLYRTQDHHWSTYACKTTSSHPKSTSTVGLYRSIFSICTTDFDKYCFGLSGSLYSRGKPRIPFQKKLVFWSGSAHLANLYYKHRTWSFWPLNMHVDCALANKRSTSGCGGSSLLSTASQITGMTNTSLLVCLSIQQQDGVMGNMITSREWYALFPTLTVWQRLCHLL